MVGEEAKARVAEFRLPARMIGYNSRKFMAWVRKIDKLQEALDEKQDSKSKTKVVEEEPTEIRDFKFMEQLLIGYPCLSKITQTEETYVDDMHRVGINVALVSKAIAQLRRDFQDSILTQTSQLRTWMDRESLSIRKKMHIVTKAYEQECRDRSENARAAYKRRFKELLGKLELQGHKEQTVLDQRIAMMTTVLRGVHDVLMAHTHSDVVPERKKIEISVALAKILRLFGDIKAGGDHLMEVGQRGLQVLTEAVGVLGVAIADIRQDLELLHTVNERLVTTVQSHSEYLREREKQDMQLKNIAKSREFELVAATETVHFLKHKLELAQQEKREWKQHCLVNVERLNLVKEKLAVERARFGHSQELLKKLWVQNPKQAGFEDESWQKLLGLPPSEHKEKTKRRKQLVGSPPPEEDLLPPTSEEDHLPPSEHKEKMKRRKEVVSSTMEEIEHEVGKAKKGKSRKKKRAKTRAGDRGSQERRKRRSERRKRRRRRSGDDETSSSEDSSSSSGSWLSSESDETLAVTDLTGGPKIPHGPTEDAMLVEHEKLREQWESSEDMKPEEWESFEGVKPEKQGTPKKEKPGEKGKAAVQHKKKGLQRITRGASPLKPYGVSKKAAPQKPVARIAPVRKAVKSHSARIRAMPRPVLVTRSTSCDLTPLVDNSCQTESLGPMGGQGQAGRYGWEDYWELGDHQLPRDLCDGDTFAYAVGKECKEAVTQEMEDLLEPYEAPDDSQWEVNVINLAEFENINPSVRDKWTREHLINTARAWRNRYMTLKDNHRVYRDEAFLRTSLVARTAAIHPVAPGFFSDLKTPAGVYPVHFTSERKRK